MGGTDAPGPGGGGHGRSVWSALCGSPGSGWMLGSSLGPGKGGRAWSEASCGEPGPFEGGCPRTRPRRGVIRLCVRQSLAVSHAPGPAGSLFELQGVGPGLRPVESQPALSEEPGDLRARSNLKVPARDTAGDASDAWGRGAGLREAEAARVGWHLLGTPAR